MIQRDRLLSIFNVRPSETLRTLLVLGFSFSMGFSLVLYDTAAYARFLKTFSAEILPYSYLVSGLILAVTGAVYQRLGARWPLRRLLVANLLTLTAVSVLIAIGVPWTEWDWLIFGLLTWGEILTVLLGLSFLALAAGAFDIRQGKRLFGLINSGELLAGALGGLSVPLVVPLFGPNSLLLLAALGVSFCALVAVLVFRRFPERFPTTLQRAERQDDSRWSTLRKSRYVRQILLVSMLGVLALYLFDYLFYERLDAAFGTEAELASFLGVFNGARQLIQLGVGGFLSGRLLERFGLRFGLTAAPVNLTLGALAMAVLAIAGPLGAAFFSVMVLAKLGDGILRSSVEEPAEMLMWQPLPPKQRASVSALAEATLGPLVGSIAGVCLLLLARWDEAAGSTPVVYALLVVAIAWVVVVLPVTREYPNALRRALRNRVLDHMTASLSDVTSQEVVTRALRSPHAGEAIHALSMLESSQATSLASNLVEALQHESPEVRLDALERLHRLERTGCVPAIRERIEHERDPRVLSRALSTLCVLAQVDPKQIAPYLDHDDPEVRSGAMLGLLRGGGLEGVLLAGRRLTQMARGSEATERMLAARILGELAHQSFYRPLLALLVDADVRVRRAALEAAGRVKHPRLWSLVLENLSEPGVHRAAARTLAEAGDDVIGELGNVLSDASRPREIRLRVLAVCGRIGSPRSIGLLLKWLAVPDPQLRGAVLSALYQCRYAAEARTEQDVVRARIRAELEAGFAIVVALRDVSGPEAAGPLVGALGSELAQTAQRILALLSFVVDRTTIHAVRRNLVDRNRDRRAYALELLETQLDGEFKRPVLALLQEERPEKASAQLEHLLTSPPLDPVARACGLVAGDGIRVGAWTRACALKYCTESAHPEALPAVRAALHDEDPLVRETAAWALCRLDPEGFREWREALPGSIPPCLANPLDAPEGRQDGECNMLLTLEKVLILRGVPLFREIPEDVLAKVAAVVEEKTFDVGQRIIVKGEAGDCMYIIVRGRIRIHDGERTLRRLGPRELFGEVALLDAQPRTASATVEEESLLLTLDQDVFYDLMEDHVEIVRGILRVLAARFRNYEDTERTS